MREYKYTVFNIELASKPELGIELSFNTSNELLEKLAASAESLEDSKNFSLLIPIWASWAKQENAYFKYRIYGSIFTVSYWALRLVLYSAQYHLGLVGEERYRKVYNL